MKPSVLFLDDRSERVQPLLDAAAQAGWEASRSPDLRQALELSGDLPPDAVVVSVSSRDFRDAIHAASALGDPGQDGGPAVILTAPWEIADDLRPLAAAAGILAVLPEREAGVSPEEIRQVLHRFEPGSPPPPKGGGEASLPALISAALRLVGLQREASLGSRRTEALLRIADLAAHQVPLDELAPMLLDLAVRLTGSRSGWVSLRSTHAPGGLDTVTVPPDLDREALNLALSLVQETTCLDARELSGESTLWASVGFNRILVSPLASGTSGWVGVADAEFPYGPGERVFLEAIASVLVLHSRNSAAFLQAKIATEESKALFKAATLILPYEEPQVVARQVSQTVASVLGYKHCAVLLPDPQGANLTLAGASGALERVRASLALDGPGLTVQAFRTGRMVYCPDTHQSPTYVLGWPECRAELAIPLIHRNEILGILDLQSEREQAFQGKDLRVLEAFAQRVATLIYAARQYQSLHATKERYESLCDGAPMGLFTWSMNTGRIEQASAVLKSWVGEDLEGRLVDTIFASASREVWKRWTTRDGEERAPFSAPVKLGGSSDIPPIDCALTAYPGRGRLHIPGHAVLLAHTAEEIPGGPPGAGSFPATAVGKRVVLADPDPVWSAVTRIMLEEWGYAVGTASEASELADRLEVSDGPSPSLVILDQTLLDWGGNSPLATWLRSPTPGPVLVLGGSDSQTLPPGKVLRLAKPYRMMELRGALEALLSP